MGKQGRVVAFPSVVAAVGLVLLIGPAMAQKPTPAHST